MSKQTLILFIGSNAPRLAVVSFGLGFLIATIGDVLSGDRRVLGVIAIVLLIVLPACLFGISSVCLRWRDRNGDQH